MSPQADSLEALLAFIATNGLIVLAVIAVVERLLLIIPSSVLLVAVGIGAAKGYWCFADALLLSTLGSLIGYALCYSLGVQLGPQRTRHVTQVITRFLGVSISSIESTIAQVRDRQRSIAFFAQLIPSLRIVAPMLAGALRTADARTSVLAITAGITLWNAAFIGAGLVASNFAPHLAASAVALNAVLAVLAATVILALLNRFGMAVGRRIEGLMHLIQYEVGNLMDHRFKRRAAMLTTTATLAIASFSPVATAQPIRDSDGWRFNLGVGVINQPKYPGSDDTETKVLPILSGAYGRFTIGAVPGAGTPAGIGFNFIQNEQWRVGLAVGGQLGKPRQESDSPNLRGLGDIDSTALGSIVAVYTHEWLSIRGLAVTDIGGEDQGTRLALDFEGKYQWSENLTLKAGPGVVWADNKYTQKFFGIDSTQSANSGLAPYSAESGFNLIRITVGADYRLTRTWNLGAFATAGRLVGDAADSPITESKSQNQYGVFATYRF